MNENIKITIKKRELVFMAVYCLIAVGLYWIGYLVGHGTRCRLVTKQGAVNDQISIVAPKNGWTDGVNGSGLANTAGTGTPAGVDDKETKSEAEILPGNGSFVAAKTGTKYYPADCTAADRIKSENKIYFDTESEAQDAGYELATRC